MISVIIPVYNAEQWLTRCIDSLISQTVFQEMEIIVIDDGSQDSSGKIIDSYAMKYPNIICKHIQNGGVSNARNTGLDLCSGEYVTFVDADDYFDNCFIEKMFSAMDDDCDIVCSGFIAEYGGTNVIRCPKNYSVLDNKAIIREFLVADQLEPNVNDKLFRRSAIGEKRFDTSIAIAEDKYFLFQCIKDVKKVKMIPVANYHYVMNDDSACRLSFSEKQLHCINVADSICESIKEEYPEFYQLAQSMAIDVKCRVYGEMFRFKAQKKYATEFYNLKRDIRNFNICVKIRNSSKKHVIALIAAKISPALYVYLKYDMKLQYRRMENI